MANIDGLHAALDSKLLRSQTPHDLALHLRDVCNGHSVEVVSAHLLEAIERKSIPPTIYRLFLTAVKNPPLSEPLRQQFSQYVRKSAIDCFGVQLKGDAWEDAWNDVGGVPGLLILFAELSVLEVKQFCKVIGRCKGRSKVEAQQRQAKATELFKPLLPSYFTSRDHTSRDQRPLHRYYARILPACTSECVREVLSHENQTLQSRFPIREIVKFHPQLVRNHILDTLKGEDSMLDDDILPQYLRPLLQSEPSLPGVQPGFSMSMETSEDTLKILASSSNAGFSIDLSRDLLKPFLRRLKADRIDLQHVGKIIDLAIEYYQSHEEQREDQLALNKGGLIFHTIHCWSTAPSSFEPRLVALFELYRFHPHQTYRWFKDIFSTSAQHIRAYVVCIFDAAKKSSRYDLLRLFCRHALGAGYDIESDEGLKSLPILNWPVSFFKGIGASDGISLLQRLRHFKDDGDFLEFERPQSVSSPYHRDTRTFHTIFSHPLRRGVGRGDPALLLIYLKRAMAGSETDAQFAIDAVRNRAATSRDPDDRAFFVSSAAFYAIASGSLELYGKTIEWMRRFLGDYKVVKTAYSAAVALTIEGISLLSGVPGNLKGITMDELRGNILKSNGILLQFLSSATTALREPAFDATDWYGTFSLFREVITHRVGQAAKVQRYLKLADDELYDILWAPTLATLIDVERIGLAPENARLKFNTTLGPLQISLHSFGNGRSVDASLPSTYCFLDNLARSRDQLWQELRPTWDPAVAALGPPFPRGLPIQCLTYLYAMDTDQAASHTPYLTARAKAIVLIEPSIALSNIPTDEETQSAIGRLVDDYSTALAIYIKQHPPGSRRDEAVAEATRHAIHQLSGRLRPDEVERFWNMILRRIGLSLHDVSCKPKERQLYPKVPTDANPHEPTKWHPENMVTQAVKARKLASTVLDCMLFTNSFCKWEERNDFQVRESEVPALSALSMWSLIGSKNSRELRSIPIPERDGIIATALLYQSSKLGAGTRLLAAPFPLADDVRYPSLFLDEESLQYCDKHNVQPTKTLARFIDLVPPKLLLQSTLSALDQLSGLSDDSPELADRIQTAYRLLKLLSNGDRPKYASELIVQAIIDGPRSSSWNRQLLAKNYLARLSAQDSQDIISSFASSIHTKLKSQATFRYSKTNEDTPKPQVKVTTVKFLAQLLERGEYVSPKFAVGVLSNLFIMASHIDIRYAVLQSLLSRLEQCDDESSQPLVEDIFSALEAMVPILGALNERKPMQDSDWKKMEQTGEVPEMYDLDDDLSPLMGLIHDKLRRYDISQPTHRKFLFERVILPAIEKSRTEHTRWTQLFIRKYAFESSTQMLDPPTYSTIIKPFVKSCYHELPVTVLRSYHQFASTNAFPPTEIPRINERVSSDPDLRDSDRGLYWLALYGVKDELTDAVLPKMLQRSWIPTSLPEGGIQLSHVQDLVFVQATTLLERSDPKFTEWKQYWAALKPPHQETDARLYKSWLQNCKPVIERLITHVDSLRPPAWQRDPNRKPRFLPDAFTLRLWLLPYPHVSHPESSLMNRAATFAKEVLKLLDELMKMGLRAHAKFKALRDAAMKCYSDTRIWVALSLINQGVEDSDTHILKLEMAEALLTGFDFQERRCKGDAEWKRMTLQFLRLNRLCKDSDDEAIRMKGWSIANQVDLGDVVIAEEMTCHCPQEV